MCVFVQYLHFTSKVRTFLEVRTYWLVLMTLKACLRHGFNGEVRIGFRLGG